MKIYTSKEERERKRKEERGKQQAIYFNLGVKFGKQSYQRGYFLSLFPLRPPRRLLSLSLGFAHKASNTPTTVKGFTLNAKDRHGLALLLQAKIDSRALLPQRYMHVRLSQPRDGENVARLANFPILLQQPKQITDIIQKTKV